MRVAITGIGLICPAGVGLAESVETMNGGGVSPALPPENERGAGEHPRCFEVPSHFKPRAWLKRRKDLKLMARANRLAVAAARMAVTDAGLDDADLSKAGLFMGVGREPGTLDDVLPALAHSRDDAGALSLKRLVDEGMGWMNPLSSLKTLPNMSPAHVAINLGCMGPTITLSTGARAGTDAVMEAALAIAEGLAPLAIAGGADTRLAFTDREAARRVCPEGETPGPVGEAAALFVLEPLTVARARGAHVYGVVSPFDAPAPPKPFGDCGAATGVATIALALGLGSTAAAPGILVAAPATEAPALRTRTCREVAITGVGMVTPLGHNLDTVGTALLNGESAIGPIQAFNAPGFPVKNAAEVPDFDASSMLPPELFAQIQGQGDRRAAFALTAAVRAAADHGALSGEAGVCFATGLSSVTVEELSQDCVPYIDAKGTFDYAMFGETPAPSRPQAPHRHLVDRPVAMLAEHLNLSGPQACHFSACAAGSAAIARAADLVRRGEAPMMLVGAADAMIHPFGLLPFILLGATTNEADPELAGRPFDATRDGFVMGEGAAFFVLEPLDRARAAGRHVYGTLLGSGTSLDAYNITAPHPQGAGAEAAMRAAIKDAGLTPADIDYVNAHGTATPLNDVVEAQAIGRVFKGCEPQVSSCKGQLGHGIAAAGALELVACLAAFKFGRLPPNPHLRETDPGVEVPLVGPVGPEAPVRYILSNSFGFGGQNACIVVGAAD